MKRFAVVLLCFVAFYSSSNAQIDVYGAHSLKIRFEDLLGGSIWENNQSTTEGYEHWEIVQYDLLAQKRFDGVPFFAEAGFSFRQVRRDRRQKVDQSKGVLYALFVNDGNKVTEYLSDYYHLGAKLGGGVRFAPTKPHGLLVPFGLQFHVPLVGPRSGFGYGVYLRPTFEFAGGSKTSSRWRLSFYTEVDLQFRYRSEFGPSFMLGGGMALSYRIDGLK